MNNNIEQFGDFMSAPSNQPPPIPTQSPTLNQLMNNTAHYQIDNYILYKKLIEVQQEIKELKVIINNLNYSKPIYYPAQNYPLMNPNMFVNNNLYKPNQI